jgi:hypothetical protein
MPLKNVLKSFPEKSFVDLIDDTPSTEYSATLVASTGVSCAGRWLLRAVFVTEVTISFFTELN